MIERGTKQFYQPRNPPDIASAMDPVRMKNSFREIQFQDILYFSVSPTGDASDFWTLLFIYFLLNSISRKTFPAAVWAVKAQPKEKMNSAILACASNCFIQVRCFSLSFSYSLQKRTQRLFLRQMNTSALSHPRFWQRL